METEVSFNYINHNGKSAERHVLVMGFARQPHDARYYPDQYVIHAHDLDKNAGRTFALSNISGWSED